MHTPVQRLRAFELAMDRDVYAKKISKNFVRAHELGGKGKRRTSNFPAHAANAKAFREGRRVMVLSCCAESTLGILQGES
jgi:hypothetical protein